MDSGYWRRVGLVLLWQVAASMCYYMVYAAAPFFRDAFGLSRFLVGVVVMTITLGYAVFLLPLGALTDRFGERRTLAVGLAGLSGGAVLVAVVPSLPTLLVATFLLGSLYGTAMPGTNKAIYENIEAGRQNTAIGVKQVGVTVGSAASALLVTGLANVLFWEAGFLVAAGFAIIVTGVFVLTYRTSQSVGTAAYPDFGAVVTNRPYRSLVAAGLFLGAAVYTTTGYTVLYIEESIGASIFFAGGVLALLQLSGSVGRILMGWLSDILPGDPQVRIGKILIVQAVASAALFVVASFMWTPITAAVVFGLLGFFVLGLTGIYYSCMATLVRAKEVGGATAGGQLALTTGGLLAPPIFGFLADTIGYRASWSFLAMACVIAALLLVRVVTLEPPIEDMAMAE